MLNKRKAGRTKNLTSDISQSLSLQPQQKKQPDGCFSFFLLQYLRKESFRAFLFRMLEDIQRATFFDDDAAINEEDAGADFSGESHFMCHDDHGHGIVFQLPCLQKYKKISYLQII